MYHDYDVVYETSINEFLVPTIIGAVILIITLIISFIALVRIFQKANRSGINAIIPIYNMIVLLEIVNMSTWQVIFLLIPGVNLIVYAIMMYKVCKSFRKSNAFSIGCIFLPFIFLPILGFSDSEYIGINKEAMIDSGTTSEMLEKEDENLDVVKTKTESSNLDISIGGGVYQKDYEKSLLKVEEDDNTVDTITTTPTLTEEEKKQHIDSLLRVDNIPNTTPPNNSSNSNTITQVKQNLEDHKEKTGVDLLNEISFVEINPQEPTKVEVVKEEEPIATTVDAIPTIIVNTQEDVSVDTNNSVDSDYVKCINCGAIIKKDAPKCFMCGKEQ